MIVYKDRRNRQSSRPSPVPGTYKAYVFCWYGVDTPIYKVILAPNLIIANQRIKDFSIDNEIDAFWRFVAEDDFEVVYTDYDYNKLF